MKEIQFTPGMTISEPGIYKGVPMFDYHNRRDLFDGPSVSKSALKWLLPTHGGSPKAFWGRWKWNPLHVKQEANKYLEMGRLVHCLLLGDEVFSERFAVQPETYPNLNPKKGEDSVKKWNNNASYCREWLEEQAERGLTVVTVEQIERVRKMAADAATYPLVRNGLLNGAIERTMCFKDPETGIWLLSRPDATADDGIYGDLKTASKFDEDFLSRQLHDAGYYLQGAIIRMTCRALGLPFDTFALLYVLNDDVPDTTHVELHPEDLDRGEEETRWCLRTIRACLDSGEWPGAQPFDGGTRHIRMKTWDAERTDRFLEQVKEAA